MLFKCNQEGKTFFIEIYKSKLFPFYITYTFKVQLPSFLQYILFALINICVIITQPWIQCTNSSLISRFFSFYTPYSMLCLRTIFSFQPHHTFTFNASIHMTIPHHSSHIFNILKGNRIAICICVPHPCHYTIRKKCTKERSELKNLL